VASSTGGPNALAEMIPALPKDFPVPVVVVQHMPPVFTQLLAERLDAASQLAVREGLEAGVVYIAPGSHHMVARGSGAEIFLHLCDDPPENCCRPAADVLFRSVAQCYRAGVLGVVLTGMGQDGYHAAQGLKASGAYVIAQDEASSVVWGMPGMIARTGLADAVVDLKLVAPEILRQF